MHPMRGEATSGCYGSVWPLGLLPCVCSQGARNEKGMRDLSSSSNAFANCLPRLAFDKPTHPYNIEKVDTLS